MFQRGMNKEDRTERLVKAKVERTKSDGGREKVDSGDKSSTEDLYYFLPVAVLRAHISQAIVIDSIGITKGMDVHMGEHGHARTRPSVLSTADVVANSNLSLIHI